MTRKKTGKHGCTGTTKKHTLCNAHPLKGTNECLAHSDEETRASVGFGGSEAGSLGGRPKLPRVVDIIRERIEAQADQLLDALFNALEAEEGVAIAVKGGGATLVAIPDHRTRITAAKELLDRAYGKPKQQTEITGGDGGPVEFVPVARDEAHGRRVAELLAGTGAVRT